MSASEQAAARYSPGFNQQNGYSGSKGYGMMGRSSMQPDYSSQALNRGQYGMGSQYNNSLSANRYYRY